jgi:pyrroloquinoline quinone (PQQ) biosynthesis protein C
MRSSCESDGGGAGEVSRDFRDAQTSAKGADLKPVAEFTAELDEIVTAYQGVENLVYRAIGEGHLSLDYVKRLCKEFYYLGVWYTTEFATLIANAPDSDALWLESSEHYFHWAQNFADEVGWLGDPSHVGMKLEWARQLGIGDEELTSYIPMPETIASVLATLYYIRRSYEEGLAAFGFAGERAASKTEYAKILYEGLRDHYGLEVENFAVHAYAEEEHGAKADELIRQVAITPPAQRRMRRAVLNVSILRGARIRAMNGWLDAPGALRD